VESKVSEPSSYKSTGGIRRVAQATRYSAQGLAAAFRHEAAFRQELLIGVPMIVVAPFLGKSLPQTALLIGCLLAVFIVELLNSAIEAIADAVSVEHHDLLGRAKDFGSAAVLFSLLLVVLIWASILWPTS
jgi:diacylglycerol kinase (ATP)